MQPGDRPLPTLAHLIRANAERFGEQTAILTPSARATYDEIWDRAQIVAAHLNEISIGTGDRVAILAENCVEWIEVATAVSCSGATLVALSTWVEEWDLKRLLSSSRPSVVFVSSRVRNGDVARLLASILSKDPGSQLHIVEFGGRAIPGALAYSELHSVNRASPHARGRGVGLVLYSSGSTSTPKGVALVNEDIIINATAIGDRLGLTHDDRLYVPMPFFWAMGGANGIVTAFSRGATVVTAEKFSPAAALDLIECHRCTALYTLPNMTRPILEHPDFSRERVASLQRGITVGSPAEVRDAVERLGVASICNVYGASEVYANATVTPHDAPLPDRLATQGPPLPGVTVRVVDPATGRELGPGVQGEIQIKGRVAAGYLQEDGRIDSIVNANDFFATGDLGTVDDRGWLNYIGRATDMVKTRGINVSPVEVEEFLCTHDQVSAALVFGIESRSADQLMIAMVVTDNGSEISEESLREWCTGRIAGYKIPRRFVCVDELPSTATGKVSRSIAKQKYHEIL